MSNRDRLLNIAIHVVSHCCYVSLILVRNGSASRMLLILSHVCANGVDHTLVNSAICENQMSRLIRILYCGIVHVSDIWQVILLIVLKWSIKLLIICELLRMLHKA